MSQTMRTKVRFAVVVLIAAGASGAAAVWSEPIVRNEHSDLESQYAKAQLRLAELNLQKLKRTNERLARTVPADVVSEYQQDVEIAREQVRAAESADAAGAFAVWLRRAAANDFAAQAQWKSAVKANQAAANTVDQIDVARLETRAQLARLQLDRGKLLAAGSADAQLRWQMSLLVDEVQRLKEEQLRGEPAARIYYRWRY